MTSEVMAAPTRGAYRLGRGRDRRHAFGGWAPARLARGAPAQPARALAGGAGVHPPPELRRDGPLPAEPGPRAAARRAPRGPAARAQRAVAGRRLRARLSRARAR